ncbi:hypothetical protein SNEBB_007210 [Seison nebaliae]|nr:hypothetical protein SNEBB_007210 [Seison nebaliae]
MPDVLLFPGDRIGNIDEFDDGFGTYVRDRTIYSSIVGHQRIYEKNKEAEISEIDKCVAISADDKNRKRTKLKSRIVEIIPLNDMNSVCTIREQSHVMCRILNVTPYAAKCLIEVIDHRIISNKLRGQIKKEDVRVTERDMVNMFHTFASGDIVVAKVKSVSSNSLGFILTTAEEELGVIIAKCGQGNCSSEDEIDCNCGAVLIPANWKEMICPTSGRIERRKCAKVQEHFIEIGKKLT